MPELSIVDPIQQMNIGLNQHALDEWVEWRRTECKKKVGQLAMTKLINKMLQWTEADQQRLVDHAICEEWKGVYWVDPPKQPKAQSTRDTSLEQDLNNRDWAK
jgi:hypothetical protein